MKPSQDKPKVIDVEACVRGNTGSAALSGALLMVFGFFWFEGATGSGTFLLGDTIFHWTLRMGGLMMIVAAAWCSIGVPVALLVDAMLSIFIGLLLILSAVLMTIGGGLAFSYPIYAICGAIFITYGVRDLRDYRGFPVSEDEDDEAREVSEKFAALGEPTEGPPRISPLPPTGDPVTEKRRSPGPPASTPDGYLSVFSEKNKPSKR
jgi:hypothetical protein